MQQIEGVSQLLLVCCAATGKDVVPFFGPSSANSTVLMVGVRLPLESDVFVNVEEILCPPSISDAY